MDAASLTQVLARVERSRVRLIAGSLTAGSGDDSAPWFGTLSSRLVIKASTSHAHAATDGTHLFYNPAVWSKVDEREGAFVWAHEVLHCGLCHMWRKPTWVSWHEWNIDTDYAVNGILVPLAARYGWLIPKGILFDAKYDGMSAEQIAYARQKERDQQKPPPPPPDEPSDDESQDEQGDDSDDTQEENNQDADDPQEDQDDSDTEDEGDGSEPEDSEDSQESDEGTGEPEGDGTEPSDSDDAQEGEGDGTLTPEDDLRPPPTGEGTGQGEGDDEGDDEGGEGEDDSQAGAERHDEPAPVTEDDWQNAVEQAMAVARKAGAMPGTVERAIDAGRPSGVAWREIMRQFIESCVPSRQTWGRLNKRLLPSGIHLPGVRKENVPPVVIAVDTSGSITAQMLNDFAEHVQVIWQEVKPRSIHVVYHDTRVAHVETFVQGEDDEITVTPYGGGGTEFQPVFDYVTEMLDSGEWEKPACLVWLTDGEAWGPYTDPESYPVMWAMVPGSYVTPPFGEVVRLA